MRAGKRAGRLRRFLRWGAWPLLLVPATILAHEAGHLAAAFAVGFPDPALHFSSISHGDVRNHPPYRAGIVGMAGPLVSVLLAILGLVLAGRRRGARWAIALAVAAASRFAVGVPYTLVNGVMLATGRRLQAPAFDEYKAAAALGWSGDLALAATTASLLAVLAWLAFALPRGERVVAWSGLMLGTGLGWALWMGFAGPLLLP